MSFATGQVVFVPGFMQRGASWAAVAARINERYPSVCLDHRAFTFEGRIEEIRQAAAPGAALVGYSLGGRLCLRAALREKQRYRALVLVGASAGIDDERERATRRQSDEALAASFERRTMPEIVARWERQAIFATQSSELVAAQREQRLAHAPGDLAALLRSAGQGSTEPVWGSLPELELPVLTIAGMLDERYASESERIAGLVPNGRAEIVPAVGHAPQLESPDAVGALLMTFLDSLGPFIR